MCVVKIVNRNFKPVWIKGRRLNSINKQITLIDIELDNYKVKHWFIEKVNTPKNTSVILVVKRAKKSKRYYFDLLHPKTRVQPSEYFKVNEDVSISGAVPRELK